MATDGTKNDLNKGGGAVGQEKIKTDIVTLTRFLTEEQAKHPEATGDFTYGLNITPMSLVLRYLTKSLGSYAMPFNLLSKALHIT